MSRNAPKEPSPFDKGEAAFWRAIKSGDYLSLSDSESFASALAAPPAGGAGGKGSAEDYLVGDIRDFELLGPEIGKSDFSRGRGRAKTTYRFIELRKEGSGPLYLTLADSIESFELRLYFIPSGLEGGTRDDFIDRGETWLFLPPRDPEDFLSSELEYAPYPDVPEIEDGGRSRKLVFSRVGPAVLYGESLDTRAPVIIAEYMADAAEGEAAAANPLLLVLEEGWMRSDGTEPEEGGYLTVMLGKVLRLNEIEHYPS